MKTELKGAEMTWLREKPNIAEQRKTPRKSIVFPAMKFELVQAGTRPGPFFLGGGVVDAAEDGLGLKITGGEGPDPGCFQAADLDPGLILQIRISVSRNRITFPVLGQVIWVRPDDDGDFRCGIRFIH